MIEEETPEFKDKMIRNLCDEWAETDTYIEQLCEKHGVPEFEIYGDSYGVPGIQEKVDSLVAKLLGANRVEKL